MVTIVRDDSKLIVTKGQFENLYKPLGYQIASNGKGADKKSAPISVKSEIKEEVKIEEKEEIVEKQQEEKIQEKYGFKNNKKKGK